MEMGKSRCILQADNSTYCEYLELSADKPANINRSTKVALIDFSKGSISAKTLEPFEDVESLCFYSDEISHIEDGAFSSLPNLRELYITHSSFPTLTKGILSGCHKLEKFRTYCELEEDALHEMTSLKHLELSGPATTDFCKAYIEPLKQLKILLLELKELKKAESGLFSGSPDLEDLKLYLRSPILLTESFFEGCNNLKKLYLTGREVSIGGKPFSNMPHLEELTLHQIPLNHVTKEFLSGCPNLKSFESIEGQMKIDSDAFTNLRHLSSLKMNGAHLQDSDLETLHPLSELVVLDLSSNAIKSLDTLPALPNLEQLDVGFNSISKFDFTALKKKLPKMKKLNLEANPLDPELKEELKKDEVIKVNLARRCIPL